MSVPEQERPLGQERSVVVEGGLRVSRFTEILVPVLLALLTTLLAGMITAGIAFGLHFSGKMDRISDKMDRLSERISHNGERIARTEERVSRNGESIARIEALLNKRRADATPPAQQKSAQRR